MNPTREKTKRLVISLVIAIIVIAAAFPYIPFNKILRVGTVEEADYFNTDQVRSQPPNSLFFDFEVDPASGNTGGLYKGIAHSGSYSSKVFGKNTYSSAIERKAGDIGIGNLDALSMSAWVYIFPASNEVTAAYVLSINNDLGVNVCWKSVSVAGKDLPMGSWFKISGLFDLGGIELKENYKIQIYFWNNSSCDMLVDDLYIVFGGQKPRRGDSTLVDMTRGGEFRPRFNFPPFPVTFIQRDETGNGNSPWLISREKHHEGEILPYDTVLSGNFTANTQNLDDLLWLKPGLKQELFHFCPDQAEFVRISATFPAEATNFLRKGRIVAGNFTGKGSDQLIMVSGEQMLLGAFSPVRELCGSGAHPETFFTITWNIRPETVMGLGPIAETDLFSADFDGDGLSELLVISKAGSWWLIRVSGNSASPANIIASGNEQSVPEWTRAMTAGSLTTGKFLPAFDKEIVLALFPSGKQDKYGYSLRRYDSGARKFLPVFPENNDFSGKTVGLDTLKPDNRFFVTEQGGKRRILRYNREWRFDLKEISFNDTTFRVIAGIDFKGYKADHNPKYFEILRIIPGNFLKTGITSLMVIGRNCKSRDETTGLCKEFRNLLFLPNTLQFYSLPGNK